MSALGHTARIVIAIAALGLCPGMQRMAHAAGKLSAMDYIEIQQLVSRLNFALVVAAVVILPFLIGNYLGDRLRMPDHSWRFGLALCTLFAGAAICYFGWPPRLGPDLSGGVNLIYEVKPGAWYGWPDFIGGDPVTDTQYLPERGAPPNIRAGHDQGGQIAHRRAGIRAAPGSDDRGHDPRLGAVRP